MNPVRRKLAAGEILFRQGEISSSFFVVLNGVISLYNDREGKAVEKARMTNNHIVGNLAYFLPQARNTWAKAVVDTELVEFSYSEIQASVKTLPGWTQLLLKSFGEQLNDAEKELAQFHSPAEAETLSPDDILKGCGSLRTALQSLEQTNSTWDWSKVREYAFQVFQVAALKLEPIAQAFIAAEWLQGQTGEFGLTTVSDAKLERMLEFESFIRKYKGSRTKRAMIEVADVDLLAISALIGATDGQTDHKGTAHIELVKALQFAQALPGGSGFRVDQFDLLLKKGLDVAKESTENGIRVAFNLAEMTRIKENWAVLRML